MEGGEEKWKNLQNVQFVIMIFLSRSRSMRLKQNKAGKTRIARLATGCFGPLLKEI